MSSNVAVQRLRIVFRKGERMRFISHLDVLRYWERSLKRAEIPIKYSEGFTPHPKLTFAAPLPLGFIGENELLDVLLKEDITLKDFTERIQNQSLLDLDYISLFEVGMSLPPLPTLVKRANYRICIPSKTRQEIQSAIDFFSEKKSIPWKEIRDNRKPKEYDLKQVVSNLRLSDFSSDVEEPEFQVSLEASSDLTVRPEQIVNALFPVVEEVKYCRTGFVLDELSTANRIWKQKGRYL